MMQIESGKYTSADGYTGYSSSPSLRGEGSGADVEKSGRPPPESSKKESAGKDELSEDEKKVVSELKKRDQHVRAHEAAHMGAGGGIVRGGASFSYQTGPDGRRYAIGGEVGIDASPVKDNPEATIRKMQQVRAAALAPADPSGQDRSVAAAASATAASARQELAAEQGSGSGEDSSATEKAGARPADDKGNTSRGATAGYTSKGTRTSSAIDHSATVDIVG